MTKILITHNGRFGDLIWGLPTVRAISRRMGAPVDLLIPEEFAAIVPLLRHQDYIQGVILDPSWPSSERVPTSAFLQAIRDLHGADTVLHLGYRGWPEPDCLRHTLVTFNDWSVIPESKWTKLGRFTVEDLDLTTPWITAPQQVAPADHPAALIAFTETHFELKFGLATLVLEQLSRHNPDFGFRILTVPGSRWAKECWPMRGLFATDWSGYATSLSGDAVLLTDCSAAHVLAVAMGKPAVLVEPMEARWNPVFYPLGWDGPQVTVVKGNDGRPTYDARHVSAEILRRLEQTP